jgi:ABC-type transporter Mla maintaining outer membrane lipid asymmetry permease subunit MlaE
LNAEFVKIAAAVMGLILSLPLLVALVKISMFAGALKTLLVTTERKLDTFIERVDHTFESHDERISASEGKLSVLWDGHERRTSERRQS